MRDLDQQLERAGARELLDDDPGDVGAGRCAMLEDPAGAVFSVITLVVPA